MRRYTIIPKGETPTVKRMVMAVAVLVAAGLMATAAAAMQKDAIAQRADIFVIDTLGAFGPLERPPVLFFHDKHTQVAAELKKDCTACHPVDKETGALSLKYQRMEDTGKQAVQDIYHTQCIACHKDNPRAGERPGPVTCGECHVEDKAVENIRQPIVLDASLHYRHTKARDNKCEDCHHEYDDKTKKLFYAKGREGACLYCHKKRSEENRMAYPQAAHMACVGCHRELSLQDKDAGPLACSGCHDPKQQSLIARVDDVPRLERGQPDETIVNVFRRSDTPESITPATVVPFDHKSHEGFTGQCRTCHHAAMAPCADCHTVEGHQDGERVKLAQAMHQRDAAMSCVGCHARKQMTAECAGCHSAVTRQSVWSSEAACQVCHMAPDGPARQPMEDSISRQMAVGLVAQRQQSAPVAIATEEIPEQVAIGHLKDQYEAVNLPHRKIVLALMARIGGNRLAAAFHTQPATVCQGCHHNGPATAKPPQCNACHGRSSDALNLTRPGLMAAYHQQCFQCHDQMGIEKPASRECTACHAKRNS